MFSFLFMQFIVTQKKVRFKLLSKCGFRGTWFNCASCVLCKITLQQDLWPLARFAENWFFFAVLWRMWGPVLNAQQAKIEEKEGTEKKILTRNSAMSKKKMIHDVNKDRVLFSLSSKKRFKTDWKLIWHRLRLMFERNLESWTST